VLGDRLLTDILLANLNGALSVYCKALDKVNEPKIIKFARFVEENIMLKSFQNRR